MPTLSFLDRAAHAAADPGLEFLDDDEDEEEQSAPAILIPFVPTYLIFEQLKLGPSPIAAIQDMEEKFRRVRRSIGKDFDETLRIACVGSHESLWHHEHSTVGFLTPEAAEYLREAWRKRRYVADLHETLKRHKWIKIEWLVDAYPHLAQNAERKPDPELPELYRKLAAQAREDLRHKPRLAQLNGTVPLIYSESRGEWQLYADGPVGPSRVAGRLIQQFSQSQAHSDKRRSVLVKLLPDDPARHNPCDNPSIDTRQLRDAARAGIADVLLDARYGFVHECKLLPGVEEPPLQLPRVYAA